MEVKTNHSFRRCGSAGRLSLASHRTGWVEAADAYPPMFVVSGMSHGLGGEKADVLSPLLINPGAGFRVAASVFSCDINSDVPNHPPCAFNFL
jgi:hypothetical protein